MSKGEITEVTHKHTNHSREHLRFVLSHGRSVVLTKAFDLKVVSAGVGSRMGNELEFMGKLVVFGQLSACGFKTNKQNIFFFFKSGHP